MQQINAEEAPDHNPIQRLYDSFSSIIFTYLLKQVTNLQDAEDLLLDVFIAAFKDKMLFDLPAERQLAWLRRVARNKVIDRYRHKALLTLLPLEQAADMQDNQLTPEQSVERQENYTRLYQALRELSHVQQELILLRYGNGLRFAEIAEILEKPEGTLRKLLVRTLRQLRTCYDQVDRSK